MGGQVAQPQGRVGMVGAEGGLGDPQRPLLQRQRLGVPPVAVGDGQAAQREAVGWSGPRAALRSAVPTPAMRGIPGTGPGTRGTARVSLWTRPSARGRRRSGKGGKGLGVRDERPQQRPSSHVAVGVWRGAPGQPVQGRGRRGSPPKTGAGSSGGSWPG